MGQYYAIVNLDKKQYIFPHKFGNGAKLLEFSCGGNTMTGLAILLADGNGRGGGDLRSKNPIIGSWAGDRIVIAGDYADKGKFIKLTKEESKAAAIKYAEYSEADKVTSLDEAKINLYCLAESYFEDISIKVLNALLDDEWIAEKFEKSDNYLVREVAKPAIKEYRKSLKKI